MLTQGDRGECQLDHYPIERTGVLRAYWERLPLTLDYGTHFRSVSCGLSRTLATDNEGSM